MTRTAGQNTLKGCTTSNHSTLAIQTMHIPSGLHKEIMLVFIVVANLINWLLHGVLTVQLYLYYLAFPNDRTWTKVSVYTVYILETIQVIGFSVTLLLMIIGGCRDPGADIFGSHQWTIAKQWSQSLLIGLFGGLVPMIAQCIYAHRIRILTQGKAIPRLIIALAFLEFFPAAVLADAMAVKVSSMISAASWAVLNIVNDLIIAFVMVRSLSEQSEFLSGYTRSKVIRLVRLIIATGLLTVVANALSLVSLFFDAYIIGDWVTATGFAIFMPKLYANSMLVMLNNRMTVRNSRDATSLNVISINALSTLVAADHQSGSSGSATSRDGI